MIATMSKHHAADRGFDDALMFDWRGQVAEATGANAFFIRDGKIYTPTPDCFLNGIRSEEHTSELQSLMRISYAVFCLKKKNKNYKHKITTNKHAYNIKRIKQIHTQT